MKKYTHAFSCIKGKCYEDNSCPCWVEIIETNTKTGEERVVKNCIFQLLPNLMIEVIKASNRPAAAIESTRNEIAKGFNNLGIITARGLQAIKEAKIKAIEAREV